jgi:adenylosuccinate lyase
MVNDAISPLDGRYFEKTRALAPFFSEQALMRYRVMMEGEYLIALSLSGKTDLRKFTTAEIKTVRALAENFNENSYKKIKEVERTTNHDVKAVEYFMKEELTQTSLKDATEWVHFALTSEDTNNIAYALMLSEARDKVMLPKLEEIAASLETLAKRYNDLPMLARTHGQPASPTTFGKEMLVFAARLKRQVSILKSIEISAKLNGATGNWNAHTAAYPKINWLKFSEDFLKKFKLTPNLLTTQIECHDSYSEIFDALKRINTVLLDFNQDMWRYISDEWVVQKLKAGEVGSSTMPHKINPIFFENSEGNLGLANTLFEFFARKLPVSRLQRDLSDSTVERNMGVAFAHSFVAYEYLLTGLSRIEVNKTKVTQVLAEHPEVIAEAIQTILRREGQPMPYEQLKELTRGKEVTLKDLRAFIKTLKVSDKVKNELLKLTPENYTGLASNLVSKLAGL